MELKDNPALSELKEQTLKGSVTLVYAAKDELHNGAIVLNQVLCRGARQFIRAGRRGWAN